MVLDELQPAVAEAFQRSLQCLLPRRAQIEFIPCYGVRRTGRDQCQRWFHRAGVLALASALIAERAEGYDPRVLSRIRRGASLGDADLQLLQQQRADWQRRITAELQRFDALLMPTVPMIAPTIGELAADDAYFRCNGLMLRNPAIVNFLDGCAVRRPPAAGRRADRP